jgi:hypothetical protein
VDKLNDACNTASLNDKLRNARVKRETLLMQANAFHMMQTQSKLERSQQTQQAMISPPDTRILQWLAIVNALRRINYFGEIVLNIRSVRKKDIVRCVNLTWLSFLQPLS